VTALRILDIGDDPGFRRIPPCADPRFDHRTCDYWEDADRGSRESRPGWLTASSPPAKPVRSIAPDNPFAPPPREADWNPFTAAASAARPALDPFGEEVAIDPRDANPFVPAPRAERPRTTGVPRKLALLDRGRGVFGSYAKVLLDGERPVAYAQFGPLSAYPRALRIRELYPRLPTMPLPAVITCIATTADARHRGHATLLVQVVCDDLAQRGFSAVEAYPDLSQRDDATSAAGPAFWIVCGFTLVVDDPQFPVMRRELG
jgi:hypothetical protein